jgi:predicted flap endonuclease-1-like 5' DNA nuclease
MAYAAAALPQNESLRRAVAATQEVLEATAPNVDANSFVIYGFVRRKNQTGIPGLTLALTNEAGDWLRQYGYACTDARGYFELRIDRQMTYQAAETTQPAKTEAELKKEAEFKKEQERTAAAATAAGQTPESTVGQPPTPNTEKLSSGMRINTNQTTVGRKLVQLRVYNRESRVLHVESRPVVAKTDTIDYRLIILGGDDCGCTPPPEKSDGQTTPTAPSAPATPPPAPEKTAPAAAAEPRVAQLKSFENPPPAPSSGQPLEAIRGIGPKTADKLRGAGITDVPAFEKTSGAALIKVAGFDKVPPKPSPEKPTTIKAEVKAPSPVANPVEKPGAKAPTTTTKPVRIPAKTISAKPVEKTPIRKSTVAEKKKRPQK